MSAAEGERGDSQPVLSEARAGALVITLNRPRVRNAIDPGLSAAVREALGRLDADPALRVGVLTGAGGNFCAGMDLRAFRDASPAEAAATLDPLVLATTAKPLIAAIEGYALGGGLELALACDLIVAAGDARLGLPEVRWSLVPSGGGLLRLPARLPATVAMEMALSGEPQDGARLHELGLVNRVTPSGGALTTALELAEKIAANGPLAVAASKELVREAAGLDDLHRLWARQAELCASVNASADAGEGVRAFFEGRDPVFGAD